MLKTLRLKKLILKVVGLLFVLLAMLGVFLPLLPTTPFLLVAAACFAKSSPAFHQRLLSNKIFGPLIYNWQTSRSIPKKAKIIALITLLCTAVWSCYLLQNYKLLQLLTIVFISIPMVFIYRLPTTLVDKANNDT